MIPQMIEKLANNDVINHIIIHKYIIRFIVVFIILLYFIKTISIYFLGSVGANSIENVQKTFSDHVLDLPLVGLCYNRVNHKGAMG